MRSSKYAPSFRKMLAVFTAVFLMGICSAPMAIAADPAPTASLIVKMTVGLTAAEQATVIAADGGTETSTVPALRLHIIKVPAADLPTIMQKYLSDPRVSRVEENKQRKVEAMVPFDPNFGAQWALTKIGWGQVFNTPPKGTAVVAVLDTGIDASHPDLAGKIIPGVSILDSAADGRTDANGHGTSLAGIVAANTDNHAGIAGVGYAGVSVMPVTVLGSDGTGQDGDIIGGVIWAADHGANVILMGFSNAGFSQNLQDAIDYAWAKNIVVVAATGNSGQGTPTYPAGHRGVIGVSATDQNDVLAPFSNYGLDVFLAAPGVDIITTARVNTDSNLNYQTINGTSASSAFVAGVAGFMKAMNPTLTNGAILGRLARGADPAANPKDPSFTGKYGYGRVNMAKALADTGTAVLAPVGAATAAGGVVGPYRAAATCTAAATGNWNAASTWTGCGDSSPVAVDAVIINTGITVTVPTGVTAACSTITFPSAAGAASLIALESSTSSLTVSGAVTIQARALPDVSTNTNAINVGAGAFSAASVSLLQAAATNRYSQILISTGTVTITGNLTSAGTGSRLTFTDAGTLNFGGPSFMSGVAGTFTAATSTVNFYGAGAQIISPFAYTFNNVTLSVSGVKTFTVAPTINGILSLEGTATTAGVNPIYTAAAAIIRYKGSSSQTTGIELPLPFRGSGVIIDNTAGVTLGSALSLDTSASLTINSGASLNTNNYTLTFRKDFINNNIGIFNANSSNITMTSGFAQSISGFTTTGAVSMTKNLGTAIFTGPVNGNGLTINGTGGTLDLGAGLNHTFTGTWTRTAGTLNCNSSTLNLGGSVSGSGSTFTKGTGTVNYNASGAQAIAAVAYNNLTFSGSGAKTMPSVTSVGGTLSIGTGTAATIAAGQTLAVYSLYLGGIGQVSGTWGSSSSTATNKNNTFFTATTGMLNVTSSGKADQATLTVTGLPASATYGQTGISAGTSGGSGSGAVTFDAGISTACSVNTISGAVTITSGIGTCAITATKAGDANYNSATSASVSVTIINNAVTIQTSPAGKSIIVDTIGYTAPQTFSWPVGESHTINTTSPQAGTAGVRYVYANWSDGGAQSHTIITPATATTLTANFTTQYQLNTAFDVTKGYATPLTGGWYNKDTMVNLTATPNSGNLFINWTGDIVTAPTSAATTILMNGFKSVTANFGGTPYLTARVSGKLGLIDNRVWTITLTNTGTGTATNVSITGLIIDKGTGTTCTATVKSSFPVAVADVVAGIPKTGAVTLDFSNCASAPASIFSPTITFSYNGKTGSNSFYNMLR